MYVSSFALGFHGCDESVGEKILRGEEHLTVSDNDYDWLGSGIYFWENSPKRALHWANFIKDNPNLFENQIKKPFVVGAIIDLGHCLDLMEAGSLELLKVAFEEFKKNFDLVGTPLPKNEKGGQNDEDLVKRKLDCAVINYLHDLRKEKEMAPFESVRGAFWEGTPVYEGARIMAQTHIQICVRETTNIRGYFRPIPEVS
jgi:hypothetical protein